MLLEGFCCSCGSGDTGSGRRSRSGRSSRRHSPQRGAGSGEQRRQHRSGRGTRRDIHQSGSADRDRHRDRLDRGDRPGARGHEQDTQNLREQQAQREIYNERSREHRQGTDGSGGQNQGLRQSESKPREKAAGNNQKPSLELSGAMLEDTDTFRVVVIKYSEPPEARIPDTR